jgi:hypothetical protein
VSAQTDGPYGPLIPMPELTPDALRAAVMRIAPSRIPALTQHLFEATTNAQQTQSLAPLRAFVLPQRGDPHLGRVRGDRTASGACRPAA